ncbi:zf-CCHC domain-containing protein/UBN2 domain-containing protein [Gossypium australe]|uniref:Zf-CCHC domain-containing protein/UBN2 domain-containing protein n=1 Tax=Gossypium australe TaxID=47621 RepID=A0A5B6UU60_9ROSI|nr:zf-CCHC domain-containing protein/UBN2 domain-containing protein [Gossypium australe]
MKLFIQANDYEVWRIITNGPSIPIKTVEGVIISKEKSEWYDNDIKKLEVTHEGTSRVKESKISLLTFDYELFKAKLEEGINEMSDHFTHIINGLKAPGKTYSNKEMVKKMLNSLPTSWEAKVTKIEESKDLNSLSLNELIGYEMKINHNAQEIKEAPKIVGISFKSITCEKDEDSSNYDDDEEMTMFARRFKKFMRSNKGRQFQKKERLKIESTRGKIPSFIMSARNWDTSSLIILNGGRMGVEQKHKANVATWSDEDSSDEETQEVSNLCLMVIDDSKVTSNLSISNSYSFDELQDAYDELGLKFEVMNSKHKKNISNLKNENDLLSKTNFELVEKVNKMQEIIKELEKKNLDLHNLLFKVHDDHEKQLELLKSEKAHSNKVIEKKRKFKTKLC